LLTKVQLKMGLNLQPDQQRVIVVASQIPFETADLTEAAEVVFGRVAGIGGDELLNEAVEILQPAECYYYEERRRRKEWGSSGPEVQEIVLHFAADVGSGITVAVLLARLKALRDRREKEGRAQGRSEVKAIRATENANVAWSYFSKHLLTAFKVSQPRAVEIRQTDEGWYLRAEADGGYAYEGTVDSEGRVRYARRVNDKPLDTGMGLS
jgi:hypothetical protein